MLGGLVFAGRPTIFREVQIKEGIFWGNLALTLSVSEKIEFVLRPLENPEDPPENQPDRKTNCFIQKCFSDIVQILSRHVPTLP